MYNSKTILFLVSDINCANRLYTELHEVLFEYKVIKQLIAESLQLFYRKTLHLFHECF